MTRKDIIETIKDAAFFGGTIQNENLKECRYFFDNVIEKELIEPINKGSLFCKDCQKYVERHCGCGITLIKNK